MTASNWAIVLCKFSDDTSTTPDRSYYEELFTGAGSGTFNITDFFRDMSHGKLDLTGSKVFGWFTLDINIAAYAGEVDVAPEGRYNAWGLVQYCCQTARDNGVPLDDFDGVLVSTSGAGQAFGFLGQMYALCDTGNLAPSITGHEMGHGYGLDHSRSSGSPLDYMDGWDTMSTLDLCYMKNNPKWGLIGPGLNAWNMRGRGWLDESRVWSSTDPDYETVVQLRPLHRHDLKGYLAIEIDEFLFEYRPAQGWDAAFPRSTCFVHSFEDNHSYIRGNGVAELLQGRSYTLGSPDMILGTYFDVEVLEINDAELTATLRIKYKRKSLHLPHIPAVVGDLIGGVAVDAGGGIVINGHYIPIPPRDGLHQILPALEEYLAAARIRDINLRRQVRESSLKEISRVIGIKQTELNPLRVPTPRGDEKTRVQVNVVR
jgi:hypothetical protein